MADTVRLVVTVTDPLSPGRSARALVMATAALQLAMQRVTDLTFSMWCDVFYDMYEGDLRDLSDRLPGELNNLIRVCVFMQNIWCQFESTSAELAFWVGIFKACRHAAETVDPSSGEFKVKRSSFPDLTRLHIFDPASVDSTLDKLRTVHETGHVRVLGRAREFMDVATFLRAVLPALAGIDPEMCSMTACNSVVTI